MSRSRKRLPSDFKHDYYAEEGEEDDDRASIVTTTLSEQYEKQEPGVLASHTRFLLDLHTEPETKFPSDIFKVPTLPQQSQALKENFQPNTFANAKSHPNPKEGEGLKPKLVNNNNKSHRNRKHSQNQHHKRRREPSLKREENLLKVRTLWPGTSEKLLTVMRISESADDTLFSALAAFKLNWENQFQNVLQPRRKRPRGGKDESQSQSQNHSKEVQEIATEIRKEMREFVMGSKFNPQFWNDHRDEENTVWYKYCHHIYMQHQKSLAELRKCDFNVGVTGVSDDSIRRAVHNKGKQVYGNYLLDPKSNGSFLELAFASMMYNFNAIVVQFICDKAQFYVYNINPQNPRKMYVLNVGKPENGKWRHLEFLPQLSDLPWKNRPQAYMDKCANSDHIPLAFTFLQTGVFVTQVSVPEKTILEISQIEAAGMERVGRVSQCQCTLQLFNRLLVGAAKLNEFTFRMGNFYQQSTSKQSFGFTSQIDLSNQRDQRECGCEDPQLSDEERDRRDTSRSCFGSYAKEASNYYSNDNENDADDEVKDDDDDGDDDDDDENDENNDSNHEYSKFLFPPKKLSYRSNYAFQSIENMDDCRVWCESITGRQNPKLVHLNQSQDQDSNTFSNRKQFQQKQVHFHNQNEKTPLSPFYNYQSIQNQKQNQPQQDLSLNNAPMSPDKTRNLLSFIPTIFLPKQKPEPTLTPIPIEGLPGSSLIQQMNTETEHSGMSFPANLDLDLEYFDLPQQSSGQDDGDYDQAEDYENEENVNESNQSSVSPPVQSALVIDDKYCSPQIILKFGSLSKLLQEAKYTLFLLPLNSCTIHCRILNHNTNQYGPVELKTSEFMIQGGSTFYLFNPTQDVVYVRCAWFTSLTTTVQTVPLAHSNAIKTPIQIPDQDQDQNQKQKQHGADDVHRAL